MPSPDERIRFPTSPENRIRLLSTLEDEPDRPSTLADELLCLMVLRSRLGSDVDRPADGSRSRRSPPT